MKVDFQFRLSVSCDCLLLLRSEFINFQKDTYYQKHIIF